MKWNKTKKIERFLNMLLFQKWAVGSFKYNDPRKGSRGSSKIWQRVNVSYRGKGISKCNAIQIWKVKEIIIEMHCVKTVRIPSYSGPHFPAFGLNTERYSVSPRIQSECGRMRARITRNTDTFQAVMGSFLEVSRKSYNVLLFLALILHINLKHIN